MDKIIGTVVHYLIAEGLGHVDCFVLGTAVRDLVEVLLETVVDGLTFTNVLFGQITINVVQSCLTCT